MNQKSILEMARGALMERADYELQKVIENIMDPNTPATKRRKLTVTLDFVPDDSRTMVKIATSVKSTLAVTTPISSVFSVQADENGVPTMRELLFADSPGQVVLPEVEAQAQPVIAVLNRQAQEETQQRQQQTAEG